VQLEEEVRLTKEENSSLKRKLTDLEAQVPVRPSCFWGARDGCGVSREREGAGAALLRLVVSHSTAVPRHTHSTQQGV